MTCIRERTNCMHRNRGILTVGLKTRTIEIVGIIFRRPQPPKPTVLEIMFCCQNFIKIMVVHNTTSNKVHLRRMKMPERSNNTTISTVL
jgi:hypothetical protein